MVKDWGGNLTPESLHKCTAEYEFDRDWLCSANEAYLVLDGYNPEPDLSAYEWVDGVKGFDKDLKCMNGFQYEVGKTYDLGEEERQGAKGFHFCDSKESVKSNTNYDKSDSRYCKVRGLIKKGTQRNVMCARKIEIVEEIKEPEYYNGKVVCTENKYVGSATVPGFTVGKIYSIVNGQITANNGWKSCWYKTLDSLCKAMGNTFIPYKGEV
jgi:hypothetical protein